MEHSIPIMFDVVAKDREAAARGLIDLLDKAWFTDKLADDGNTMIEAWWTLDARDKHADRNDRDAAEITFIEGSGA